MIPNTKQTHNLQIVTCFCLTGKKNNPPSLPPPPLQCCCCQFSLTFWKLTTMGCKECRLSFLWGFIVVDYGAVTADRRAFPQKTVHNYRFRHTDLYAMFDLSETVNAFRYCRCCHSCYRCCCFSTMDHYVTVKKFKTV